MNSDNSLKAVAGEQALCHVNKIHAATLSDNASIDICIILFEKLRIFDNFLL